MAFPAPLAYTPAMTPPGYLSEALAGLRWSHLDMPYVLLGLVVFFTAIIVIPFMVSTQRRKQREARFEQLTQDAHEFFQGIERTGMLPRPNTNVILQKGETALLDEASTLYETRAYRVSGGAGTRIGRIYVGGGASESHQRWRQIDRGRGLLPG